MDAASPAIAGHQSPVPAPERHNLGRRQDRRRGAGAAREGGTASRHYGLRHRRGQDGAGTAHRPREAFRQRARPAQKSVDPLLTQTGMPREQIIDRMIQVFQDTHGLRPGAITEAELAEADRQARERFGSEAWLTQVPLTVLPAVRGRTPIPRNPRRTGDMMPVFPSARQSRLDPGGAPGPAGAQRRCAMPRAACWFACWRCWPPAAALRRPTSAWRPRARRRPTPATSRSTASSGPDQAGLQGRMPTHRSGFRRVPGHPEADRAGGPRGWPT